MEESKVQKLKVEEEPKNAEMNGGRQVTTESLSIERNPRTWLGPPDARSGCSETQMRGTKVDEVESFRIGSELKSFLKGVGARPPTHPGYCWIVIKTKDLQIGQFVID